MRPALLLIAVAACGAPAGTPADGAPPIDAASAIDATNDAAPMAAMLAIDTTALLLGDVLVGQTSVPSALTITNTGIFPTGSLAIAVTGAGAASFATSGSTCTGTLASGASCTVPVTFSPTAAGGLAATVVVSASPGGSVSASVSGVGVVPSMLSITAAETDLGDVLVGTSGTRVATFTVTNTGGIASGPLSVQPTGADPADFSVHDLCSGVALVGGAQCVVEVRFAPRTRGDKAAAIEVAANPGGVLGGDLRGHGVAPARLTTAFVHRDLGSVAAGASATATITFANTGDVATGPITQTYTGGSGFSAGGGTCTNAMLAPGATCALIVRLSSAVVGPKESQVTVATSPGGAHAITLAGVVTAATQLVISPSAAILPDAIAGMSSGTQVFTITNAGSDPSGPLVVTRTGAAGFTVTADTCGGRSLAPSDTCQLAVELVAPAVGPRSARLDVASPSAGAVHASVGGVAIGGALLALSPATQGFGTVAIGSSAAATFTVTNLGGVPTGAPAVSITGADAADLTTASACPAALAPGASCTILVRFAPTQIGARTATLAVTASPGGATSTTLIGAGLAPGGLVVTPPRVTFPTTLVADPSPVQVFTIRNTSADAVVDLAIATGAGFVLQPSTQAGACGPALPAGASCTVRVVFAPANPGDVTGALTVLGGATAAFASLAGTGRPRFEVVAIDSAASNATSHDFGMQPIAATIPDDVFLTLRNNTADLPTFALTTQFGMPAQFASLGNNCSNVIRPYGTCTSRLRFAPTATGPQTGTATYAIGADANSTIVFALRGTGAP